MAANRIKGITIQIGGDTTKLDKALEGTNKQLKTTQANLKDVERLLKLDPGNVELLDQKQRLLAQSAELTADKLKELKKTAEESTVSNVKYEKWQNAFTVLQGQITKTANGITALEKEADRLKELQFAPDSDQMVDVQKRTDDLRKKMADLQQKVTDTYEELGRPISINQWDALQREIAETSDATEKAEKAFKSFSVESAKLNADLSDISNFSGNVADKMAPVSKAILGIGAAVLATVPATEEFRSDMSILENNARMAGVGVDTVRQTFEQLAIVSDEVDSSVEATSNLLQAGFTESNLQMAVENLAGAYLSFPDTLKIESLADSLQETLATNSATGQFAELLDRLGISAEQFSKDLSLINDKATKQNYVLQTLSNAGLSDVYDSWMQNNQALVDNRDATLEFQQSLADLAEEFQPIITSLTEMASTFMDFFTGLPDGAQAAIVGVGAFLALISPIAGIISAITGALSAAGVAGTAFSIAGTAVSFTLGQWVIIIGVVIAAVLALVAAIALLTGKSKDVKNIEIPSVPNTGGASPRGRNSPTSPYSSPYSLQTASVDDLPHLARGTVTRANSPFLAVVGDNPQEPEVISPYSTIKQAARDAMSESSMGRSAPMYANVTLVLNGTVLGRAVAPLVDNYNRLRGVDLVVN